MTTATYGSEVMYLGQQWMADRIQTVATTIAKDIAGLRKTSAGCDAIRTAGIPTTKAMLDRRVERHFIRLLTQQNPNKGLIQLGEDDSHYEDWESEISDRDNMDPWVDRPSFDLWTQGESVEQTTIGHITYAD